MLGRHQHTTASELTFIDHHWRKLRNWHQAEKRRIKRALNKRFRHETKMNLKESIQV